MNVYEIINRINYRHVGILSILIKICSMKSIVNYDNNTLKNYVKRYINEIEDYLLVFKFKTFSFYKDTNLLYELIIRFNDKNNYTITNIVKLLKSNYLENCDIDCLNGITKEKIYSYIKQYYAFIDHLNEVEDGLFDIIGLKGNNKIMDIVNCTHMFQICDNDADIVFHELDNIKYVYPEVLQDCVDCLQKKLYDIINK